MINRSDRLTFIDSLSCIKKIIGFNSHRYAIVLLFLLLLFFLLSHKCDWKILGAVVCMCIAIAYGRRKWRWSCFYIIKTFYCCGVWTPVASSLNTIRCIVSIFFSLYRQLFLFQHKKKLYIIIVIVSHFYNDICPLHYAFNEQNSFVQ